MKKGQDARPFPGLRLCKPAAVPSALQSEEEELSADLCVCVCERVECLCGFYSSPAAPRFRETRRERRRNRIATAKPGAPEQSRAERHPPHRDFARVRKDRAVRRGEHAPPWGGMGRCSEGCWRTRVPALSRPSSGAAEPSGLGAAARCQSFSRWEGGKSGRGRGEPEERLGLPPALGPGAIRAGSGCSSRWVARGALCSTRRGLRACLCGHLERELWVAAAAKEKERKKCSPGPCKVMLSKLFLCWKL